MSDSPATSVVPDAPSSVTRADAPAQALVCSTCQGVIVGVEAGAFTVQRGQLILSNGYCQGDRCGAGATGVITRGQANLTHDKNSDVAG
ncbi:hypothetical protein [Nonomuraea sp. NPDC003214]